MQYLLFCFAKLSLLEDDVKSSHCSLRYILHRWLARLCLCFGPCMQGHLWSDTLAVCDLPRHLSSCDFGVAGVLAGNGSIRLGPTGLGARALAHPQAELAQIRGESL